MEKGVGLRVLLSPLLAIALTSPSGLAQENASKLLKDFEKRFPPTKKNSAAEEVERLSIALGIDWAPRSKGRHPSEEDSARYNAAGFNTWLDAQVTTPDESIAAAPPQMIAFLEERQAALWQLTRRLERDTPSWNYDSRTFSSPRADLLPTLKVQRLLLSAALCEERSARHVEAGRLLEAAWSLQQFLGGRPDLPSQMFAIAMEKSLVGALRKISEPSSGWLHRVSSARPWKALIDSYANEPLVVRAGGADEGDTVLFDPLVRGWRSIAEKLRRRGPCRAARLSADEFWKPIDDELRRAAKRGKGDRSMVSKASESISSVTYFQTLRRGARLAVDRELTARILALRQTRAADPEGRWPVRLLGARSRVCPEALYEYQTRDEQMMVRFKGDVTAPDPPALVLSLSFEVGSPAATPEPMTKTGPTGQRWR